MEGFEVMLSFTRVVKSAPPICELPREIASVIAAASRLAKMPPVIIEESSSIFYGCLDFQMFNTPVIRIARNYESFGTLRKRTTVQMMKTTAHECGHVIHGGSYQSHGVKVCEDAADLIGAQILELVIERNMRGE